MKINPISTFPPCYSFHIGEVIQIWLARLMWSLRNISHMVTNLSYRALLGQEGSIECRCLPSVEDQGFHIFVCLLISTCDSQLMDLLNPIGSQCIREF